MCFVLAMSKLLNWEEKNAEQYESTYVETTHPVRQNIFWMRSTKYVPHTKNNTPKASWSAKINPKTCTPAVRTNCPHHLFRPTKDATTLWSWIPLHQTKMHYRVHPRPPMTIHPTMHVCALRPTLPVQSMQRVSATPAAAANTESVTIFQSPAYDNITT